MGHVYVTAKLLGKREKSAKFLVDTGATYSLIPPDMAKEVGLALAERKMTVVLANGKRSRLPMGLALLKVDGRETGTVFLVGACDEPLLGVEALEALGLAVDPAGRRLIPTRGYAARLSGYRGT